MDEDVDPAEMLQRRVDDRLAARGGGHRLGARDRLAAGRDDLVDHLGGRAGVGAVAGEAAAGVVDHDLGAPRDASSSA